MAAYDPLDASADPFRPPAISTMVGCLHCGEEYDSYRIEWRVRRDWNGQPHGFWCCPIPGCDGMGFGFDIMPVDPDYRDENGEEFWVTDDDESDDSLDTEEENDDSSTSPDRMGPEDDEPLPF